MAASNSRNSDPKMAVYLDRATPRVGTYQNDDHQRPNLAHSDVHMHVVAVHDDRGHQRSRARLAMFLLSRGCRTFRVL